jgi:hypothetical protein
VTASAVSSAPSTHDWLREKVSPAISVVVPVTVRVVPAATVLVPAVRVRLLNVSAVVTMSVAAHPPKDTVLALALKVPPESVKLPDTDSVAVVGA